MKNVQMSDFPFLNVQEKNLSFEQVFERMVAYIKKETNSKICLMVGTDSQVHRRHTVFITGIVIKREGEKAWTCRKKIVIPRKMVHLYERISFETSLTEEIGYLLTDEKRNYLIDLIAPHLYEGADITFEGHIDIGNEKRNKTREFVNEMENRIKSVGFEPKIKPYSIAASYYANRYTK